MFLRPSLDPNIINERLNTVETMLRPNNQATLNDLVKGLKQIRNMKSIMIHLRKGVSAGSGGTGGSIKNGVWGTISRVSNTMLNRDC